MTATEAKEILDKATQAGVGILSLLVLLMLIIAISFAAPAYFRARAAEAAAKAKEIDAEKTVSAEDSRFNTQMLSLYGAMNATIAQHKEVTNAQVEATKAQAEAIRNGFSAIPDQIVVRQAAEFTAVRDNSKTLAESIQQTIDKAAKKHDEQLVAMQTELNGSINGLREAIVPTLQGLDEMRLNLLSQIQHFLTQIEATETFLMDMIKSHKSIPDAASPNGATTEK